MKSKMFGVLGVLIAVLFTVAQTGCKSCQKEKTVAGEASKPDKSRVRFSLEIFLGDEKHWEARVRIDGPRIGVDAYEPNEKAAVPIFGSLLLGKEYYEIDHFNKRIHQETLSDQEFQRLMKNFDFVLPLMDFELINAMAETEKKSPLVKVGTEKWRGQGFTRYEVIDPDWTDNKWVLLVDENGLAHQFQELKAEETVFKVEIKDLDYQPEFTDNDFKLPEGYEIIEEK